MQLWQPKVIAIRVKKMTLTVLYIGRVKKNVVDVITHTMQDGNSMKMQKMQSKYSVVSISMYLGKEDKGLILKDLYLCKVGMILLIMQNHQSIEKISNVTSKQ